MTKVYVIHGDPIPLARARSGKGKVWDAQKQLKLFWGLQLQQQHKNDPLFSGPVLLDVTFYFGMPKSSAKQHDKLRGSFHFYKPDLDNLIKWVADVSTGILYKDDCIISTVISRKLYDDNEKARTEFFIKELKKDE